MARVEADPRAVRGDVRVNPRDARGDVRVDPRAARGDVRVDPRAGPGDVRVDPRAIDQNAEGSCGEPTPRRLRGTRGPRADAGPASQAAARPAPSAGGRAGPAVPASAASCVASVAARRPSARFLRGVHAPGGPRAACAPLARRLAESWRGGNWGLHGLLANSFQMDAMGGHDF